MADAVALASVISSAAVALGGIAAGAFQGRAQRKHEKALAYEARAWEAKSTALYSAIGRARGLLDSIDSGRLRHDPDPGDTFPLHASRMLDGLVEHGGVVEVYASRRCVEASRELDRYLSTHGVTLGVGLEVEWARERKLAAIDAGDFEEAARQRDEERKVLADANAALTVDPAQLRVLTVAFIDAARDSIRGAAD